jgi:hypothetical protein
MRKRKREKDRTWEIRGLKASPAAFIGFPVTFVGCGPVRRLETAGERPRWPQARQRLRNYGEERSAVQGVRQSRFDYRATLTGAGRCKLEECILL